MPRLQSPDGKEFLDVPDEQVQHYLDRGARFAPPPPESQVIEANPFLNPVELLIGGRAARNPASFLTRGGGAAAVRGARAVAEGARRAGGALKKGASAVFGRQRVDDAGEALRRLGQPSRPRGFQALGESIDHRPPTAADEALDQLRELSSRADRLGRRIKSETATRETLTGRPAAAGLRPDKSPRAKTANAAPKLNLVKGNKPDDRKLTNDLIKEGDRISPRNVPKEARPLEGSRHTVKYFSESKNDYVDIENMNQKNIEFAINKLLRKRNDKGLTDLQAKQLAALLRESRFRLGDKGIHIGFSQSKGTRGALLTAEEVAQ